MHEQEFDPQKLSEEQLVDLLTRFACASYAGELTEEEASQLSLLLESRESARQIFLALAQDTQSLRTWAAVETKRSEPASALPVETPVLSGVRFEALVSASRSVGTRLFAHRMSGFVAFGIAGMLLAVMALPWLLGRTSSQGVDQNANLAETAIATPVAASQPMVMPLEVNALQLASGTAKLFLPKVGHVIVEGPAEFQVIGPMRARLTSGRIKMRVTEPTGKGFVVETPYGEVTDLGTEFGLDLTREGKAGLVVFDGAVDLRVNKSDEQRLSGLGRPELFVRGDGVVFGKDQTVERITAVRTGPKELFKYFDGGRFGEDADATDPYVILNVRDNLRNQDTKKFYEIVAGGMNEDALAYVDRGAHQWNGVTSKGMPSYLLGADYVRTFNDDKLRSDTEIQVMLGRPARLFVFYDRRVKIPEWLRREFRETGDEIGQDLGRISPSSRFNWTTKVGAGKSIDLRFSVWERIVTEPGIVQLGPTANEKKKSATAMYGIAAVPLVTGRINHEVERREPVP